MGKDDGNSLNFYENTVTRNANELTLHDIEVTSGENCHVLSLFHSSLYSLFSFSFTIIAILYIT